jgi:hypothetical protein
LGQIASPRGAAPIGTLATPVCTAHNFNFIPGTRTAVVAWYTGGTSVIDFADPMSPEEVGFFRASDSNTWSSYWYKGLIYASDLARGLDVLKLEQ